MPYNFVLTVFTHRNCVADFLQAKCIFYGNRPSCVFETPVGDLWATYDDHLLTHWKARSGLPISVN